MNILGSHLNVQQILEFEIPETLNFTNISQSRYNYRYEKLMKTTNLLNINNDNKWAYLVHDWFTAGAMYFTHTAPFFICLSRTIKKKKEMLLKYSTTLIQLHIPIGMCKSAPNAPKIKQ